jgi:glutaredoxin
MAKEYFDGKKVKYKEVDVSVDRDAAQWVLDHVGQVVTPVIDIDGTVVVGFDRPGIDAALSK